MMPTESIIGYKHKKTVVFISVMISTFIVHAILRSIINFLDDTLWANQIQFFLNHNSKQFELSGCYGHPGTTIVELGSIFQLLFGIHSEAALTLSVSLLIAATTAASCLFCLLLYPTSLWWLATALTLTLSRFYMASTPTTAVVMPFITLIVLSTWWFCERVRLTFWMSLFWGAMVGMAMATRIDVSLLTGLPMFLLIWLRHGNRVVLPAAVGVGTAFILSDPYMWYMPMQHMIDLTHKFRMLYGNFTESKLQIEDLINTLWLSAACIALSVLIFLHRRRSIIHIWVFAALSLITLLTGIIVLSSRYQAARYLFPICIVWEVILPLVLFELSSDYTGKHVSETVSIVNRNKRLSYAIISLLVFIQLAAYVTVYLNVSPTIKKYRELPESRATSLRLALKVKQMISAVP